MRRTMSTTLHQQQMKDFSCVGGLDKQLKIVKEMVLFPLMYGEIYKKFNMRPPRGLLFFGPPGTGKTLVASALAGECSNYERRVNFISQKGSDCLSKWIGESEKKLEKIFLQAQESKPCIIFFDEVDGLAPVRSSDQDYVHASIVSTLLALMDGLGSNSEVIVIGATNRLEAIDPALRRPGRFDRELYFPLPCFSARKEILAVHMKSWKYKPPQKFMAYVASKTVGFGGSDLQALCAEAVMCCVRRNYPEIYTSGTKHAINDRVLKVEKVDFIEAQNNVAPCSQRSNIAPIKILAPGVDVLLTENFTKIMNRIHLMCPLEMVPANETSSKRKTHSTNNCPRILLCGTDDSHTRHLGPAVLHTLEHLPCHVLDVTTLFEESAKTAEESIIQKVKTARRTLPSLLYIPDVVSWWDLVNVTARVVFSTLLQGLDRSVHVLILATAKCDPEDLPVEVDVILLYMILEYQELLKQILLDENVQFCLSKIAELFNYHQNGVYRVELPSPSERENYFSEFLLKTNEDGDSLSHKSSEEDLSHPVSARKNKPEAKTRSKLLTVRSEISYNTRSSSNKREYGGGDGTQPKRKRLKNAEMTPSNRNLAKSPASVERLSESQIQELLKRLVQITNGWKCCELESLRFSLERVLEPIEKCRVSPEEKLKQLNDCISEFVSYDNNFMELDD